MPGAMTGLKTLWRNRGLLALNASERALIAEVRRRKLTYLSSAKMASLVRTCRELEAQRIEGLFIEAGCALGGSSVLIASVKRPERRFNIYDVFGMIPPPSGKDTEDVHARYATIVKGESQGIDGDPYYGYVDNLYELVQSNLAGFGLDQQTLRVYLIKGLLQDTLQLDGPVAFAHIDVDWYEPVQACLERIFPRLSLGGSIILDDYHDWGGCRRATDEYLAQRQGQFVLDDSAGSLRVTRMAGPAVTQ